MAYKYLMKFPVSFVVFMVLVILTCLVGYTGNPLIYLFFFFATLLFAFFFIFLTSSHVTWLILPSNVKKKYKISKIRYLYAFLFFQIILFLGGWIINHYYLPDKISIISLIGDIGIICLAALIAMNFLNISRRKLWLAGIVAASLFLYVFAIANIKIQTNPNPLSKKLQKLRSLPYVSHVSSDRDVDKAGVVLYKKDLCNDGINLYNSSMVAGAYLVDLSGDVLHKWDNPRLDPHWNYVELYKGRDLLVLVHDRELVRLDWDSNIKWAVEMRVHNDIAFDDNDDIYVLTRKDELPVKCWFPLPILNDYLVILDSDGKIKKEISLYKILENSIYPDQFSRIYRWLILPRHVKAMIKFKKDFNYIFHIETPLDIFHTNTVEIIDKDTNELFRKGNVLFCAKMLDLVGVIDVQAERLLWSWGRGHLDRPHYPTQLNNGNILIYDNGTTSRRYSRILELNPQTEEIIWEYQSNPPESFYSSWGGSSQILPNGNILITESETGRVFEITRDGNVVWEFYNPQKNEDGSRAAIYRMMRITDPENLSILKKLQ